MSEIEFTEDEINDLKIFAKLLHLVHVKEIFSVLENITNYIDANIDNIDELVKSMLHTIGQKKLS